MARIEVDPNYSSPTFSRATTGPDPFKKEDVQQLAAAMSTHVHDGSGKGLLVTAIPAAAIPDGSVTSAKIADGTIQAVDIADSAITSAKILDGTIVAQDIAAGAITSVQFVQGSTLANTSSTAFVDLPEMAIAVTCEGNDVVVVTLVFVAAPNVTSANVQAAINVDGSDSVGMVATNPIATGNVLLYTQFWGVMGVGAHVFKGRWALNSGAMACNPTQRNMIVSRYRR